MSALGISVTMSDGVVAVAGEIDMVTAPMLTKTLDEVSGQLLLDLRAVSFMDSSGVRVLAAQRLQRSTDGHDCRVVALSPQVRRVLEISGLLDYLEPPDQGP
jgi:anti-sigma B factor antagonist